MIVLAAAIIAGLYAWRWLYAGRETVQVEVTPGKLIGIGAQVTPEGFLIAWGATFMILALIAVPAPALANALALLIVLGSLYGNFEAVSASAKHIVKLKGGTG